MTAATPPYTAETYNPLIRQVIKQVIDRQTGSRQRQFLEASRLLKISTSRLEKIYYKGIKILQAHEAINVLRGAAQLEEKLLKEYERSRKSVREYNEMLGAFVPNIDDQDRPRPADPSRNDPGGASLDYSSGRDVHRRARRDS